LSGSLDKSWFVAMARNPEEAQMNYEMDQFRQETAKMMRGGR